MATLQYSSFEDFRASSGIRLPHSEDRTTRRYGTYIEPFSGEELDPQQAYARILRTENDGVWEYMTPMGSGAERPASQSSHSSGILSACVPNFIKSRRSSATIPGNCAHVFQSHAATPSPPPPYTSESESWSARSADHGKPFSLLGLPKKDVEPELTRAHKEAQDVVQHQLQLINADGSVGCPRAGCRHVAENVDALTRHIHIHLVAESVFCSRCKARFEHSQELDTHKCRKRGLSSSAPIEALRRVFHIKSPHV